MLQLIRTNPGLLIWLALFGVGALVCLAIGAAMVRAGASLRPIQWFAGFFLLIGLPQFVAHLYLAVRAQQAEAPRRAALETLAANVNSAERTAAAKMIFGPDAAPELITDARKMPGAALASSEFAQFAILPTGESVLLAKFNGYSAAEKAWIQYLRDTGLNQLNGKGDSQAGYAVTRPVGDRAFILHLDNMLGVWTGSDDEAIRKRMISGGFKVPKRAPLAGHQQLDRAKPASASTSLAHIPTSNLKPAFLTGVFALYFLLVVAYFFKGAAWAGSTPAKAAAPIALSELASRLNAINSLDVPFSLTPGAKPNEYFATWRYADAKWVDLARVRGLQRTHRIKLVLDESARVVRATDMFARHDWSLGRGGADLEWKAGLGIVFFQYEHQRVFGLQLDDQGRFKPELSYAYTFNLQEMKSPLVEAVTRAGWTWRPVVWQGPTWLRWLTE